MPSSADSIAPLLKTAFCAPTLLSLPEAKERQKPRLPPIAPNAGPLLPLRLFHPDGPRIIIRIASVVRRIHKQNKAPLLKNSPRLSKHSFSRNRPFLGSEPILSYPHQLFL